MYKLENWSQRLAQQDALALTCKMTCVYVYMHNVQGREECSCKHVSNSSFTALSIFTTVSQTKSCKEFYMGDQELRLVFTSDGVGVGVVVGVVRELMT